MAYPFGYAVVLIEPKNKKREKQFRPFDYFPISRAKATLYIIL